MVQCAEGQIFGGGKICPFATENLQEFTGFRETPDYIIHQVLFYSRIFTSAADFVVGPVAKLANEGMVMDLLTEPWALN